MKNPFEPTKSPPIMPDWFTSCEALAGARLVWDENLERVTANGCHEGDSDLFARYCCLEKWHRNFMIEWAEDTTGEFLGPASASHLELLNRMAELLGIAGPTSRKSMHYVQMQQA